MRHATTTNRRFPGSHALLCLTYGLYAVLCQLSLIYLHAVHIKPIVSADVLRHVFLPYLEYPLMSITVLFIGALLFEIAVNRESE